MAPTTEPIFTTGQLEQICWIGENGVADYLYATMDAMRMRGKDPRLVIKWVHWLMIEAKKDGKLKGYQDFKVHFASEGCCDR